MGSGQIRQILVGDPLRQRQLAAWEKIEQGRVQNNQQFVWDGNEQLLKFEQEVTLQNGAYAANLPYWQSLTNHPNPKVPSMPSPIPGDNSTFQAFCDADPTVADDASIADFDARWAWIVRKQLPAYKTWSDGNQIIDAQRLLDGGYKKR